MNPIRVPISPLLYKDEKDSNEKGITCSFTQKKKKWNAGSLEASWF